MIHATRPFVLNEWIQTKIEGYEVSGTVEVCILFPLLILHNKEIGKLTKTDEHIMQICACSSFDCLHLNKVRVSELVPCAKQIKMELRCFNHL